MPGKVSEGVVFGTLSLKHFCDAQNIHEIFCASNWVCLAGAVDFRGRKSDTFRSWLARSGYECAVGGSSTGKVNVPYPVILAPGPNGCVSA